MNDMRMTDFSCAITRGPVKSEVSGECGVLGTRCWGLGAGGRNVPVAESKGRWERRRATVVHCHIPYAVYRLLVYKNAGASGDVDENKGSQKIWWAALCLRGGRSRKPGARRRERELAPGSESPPGKAAKQFLIPSDINCSGALRAPFGGRRPPLQRDAQVPMSLRIDRKQSR